MLEDIISGEDAPEHLASLALGHLRVKIPQLRLALAGKIRSHHRFLLRRLLDQVQFVEHEIALLDERLEEIAQQRPELSQAVCSLGHNTGNRSSGSVGASSRNR
jgi:hypothetical protein